MNGIEQLTKDNHTLFARVQHLISIKWKWDAIADDIGLVGPRRVMDLCEWVLEYKEPKRLPAVRSAPITWQGKPVRTPQQLTSQFVAWQRQRQGALELLKNIK